MHAHLAGVRLAREGGGNDYARDAEVQKLVAAGGSSIDPDQRRKAYGEAIQLITERAYWLPLHTYVTTYGFSRLVNFKPNADEIPRFSLASWKPQMTFPDEARL
jgi:peptide/nickel transport system substrate-binding protein